MAVDPCERRLMHEHRRRGGSVTGPDRTPSRSVTASAAELEILELQRTAGNAAVNRAMRQRPTAPVQRMEDNEGKSPGYPPDLSGLTLSSRTYEPPTLSARAHESPRRSDSRTPSDSRDRDDPGASRKPGNSGVRVAKKLSDVLPESEWWKLFMDPNDHQNAQKKHPEDPGSYYDNDRSPGFRAGMVAAYHQTLENPENTLDSESYSDLHTTVTSNLGKKPEKTGRGGQPTIFPLRADAMSEDTNELHVGDRKLLADFAHFSFAKPNKDLGRAVSVLGVPTAKKQNNTEISTNYNIADWSTLVDQIFQDYYSEISTAETEETRLEIIAKTITKLQITHPFQDGNRRLNVHVILPKLLLENNIRPVISPDVRHIFQGGASHKKQVEILRQSQI
jgi:prophage maintenance system killer protein